MRPQKSRKTEHTAGIREEKKTKRMRLFKRKTKDINKLKEDIEKALGCSVGTPKDFQRLRDAIYSRLHIIIGLSTLMRLWGYVNEEGHPRKGTLDTLAQYLGYRDWADYSHMALEYAESDSSQIMSHGISVPDQLTEGDRLRLRWLPDRICDIEYLGGIDFRIVAAANTHLHVGDRFKCNFIIENEPMYLSNLQREGLAPMNYICGKKAGVRYELLPKEENNED